MWTDCNGVGYSLLSCCSEQRTEGLSGCYPVSAKSMGFIDQLVH